MIVYAVVMCLLNDRSIKKHLGYKTPWMKAYITPFLASVPMAAVAAGVYYGLYALIHSNFISLGDRRAPGGDRLFRRLYLLISKPSEEELRMIPGGGYWW